MLCPRCNVEVSGHQIKHARRAPSAQLEGGSAPPATERCAQSAAIQRTCRRRRQAASGPRTYVELAPDLAGLHQTDLLQTSGVIPNELLDRTVGTTGVRLDLKIGDNGARLIV